MNPWELFIHEFLELFIHEPTELFIIWIPLELLHSLDTS